MVDLDDLFAADAIRDPHGFFGRLRESDPVHWNARHQVWIVTRHADVTAVVRDHDAFSSAVIRSDARPPYPPLDDTGLTLLDEVRHFRGAQLVEQDPPRHHDMRRLLHHFFTPPAIETLRPFVRAAVAELFDEVGTGKTIDVMTALAAPLPVRVIAHLMGVPEADRPQLREFADKLLHINRGEPDRFTTLTEGIRSILDYVAPLAESRLGCPGKDFISVLTEGERTAVMTRYDVLANCALLLFAGHETTMNLIGNGVLAFIRHPGEWERLRANPEQLARGATDECLRFDPPVKSTQRIAAADVTLGDRSIRNGDRIRWIMTAANRDPRAFPDPDAFRIDRRPNPHVSFGGGIHFCLGAALARVEGQELFRALAERVSTLQLETTEPEYQPSIQFRSLRELRVTLQ
ncbi:MAG TPA: cytochrome P450 [Gemmatimonadaceae bacterium]|nr:cytochrome P450 [Gemmatimonadaceae bacterium]